jgi:hypothetical protein
MHISESKPAAIRTAVIGYLPNSSFPERLKKLGKAKKVSRGYPNFAAQKNGRKVNRRCVKTLP